MRRYEQEFGLHIKSLRRTRNLTQQELAQRSGVSADTIHRLEAGKFSARIDTLRKLASGLELSLTTVFESFELQESSTDHQFRDLLMGLAEHELRLAVRVLRVMLEELRVTSRG